LALVLSSGFSDGLCPRPHVEYQALSDQIITQGLVSDVFIVNLP